MLGTRLLAGAVMALGLALPSSALAGDWGVSISYGGRHTSGRVSHGHGHARHVAVRYVHRPRVHVHGHHCHWVPGHHGYRKRAVWVRGYYTTETIPAVYEKRFDKHTCTWRSVVVRPERVRRIYVPGRTEQRRVRVWVRGHYNCGH